MDELKKHGLPWAVGRRTGDYFDWLIYEKNNPNQEICQMFHDGTEDTPRSNAELIVKAVNAYTRTDPKLEALREAATSAVNMWRLTNCDVDLSAWAKKMDELAAVLKGE